MKPVVLFLPGNEAIGHSLAATLNADTGRCEIRHFPDAESYVRILTSVDRRPVVLMCTLDRPDEKFMPLTFLAATARELGARSVGLVCPYMPYMRQDTRFHPGEAISARYFAKLLGGSVDWLVTVDPHLHRLNSLNDVFAIPTTAIHAAPVVSEWIRAHVQNPIVIGPDGESEQWVAAVAARVGAPYAILRKIRRGDRDVSVSLSDAAIDVERTPVLLDDIISTAHTMIEAVNRLRETISKPSVCMGVHAVFAEDAYEALQAAGPSRIVTCNTIPHASNAIDLSASIAEAVRNFLDPIDQ